MPLSRRGVLIGALAGGGLAVGYFLRPRRFPLPLEPGSEEWAFGAWIKIAKDGVVTVAVPQVEMGQGVTTILPQVVAHELGADWRQIAVEPAPVSAWYANLPLAARWSPLWMPFAPALAEDADSLVTRRWAQDHFFNVTADGATLAAYEEPARRAAAAARTLLIEAAAKRWDVDPAVCDTRDGLVVHDRISLPFGVLTQDAAQGTPPEEPELRAAAPAENPSDFPPGAPLRRPRLDLPSKVDGSWTFAGDVRMADMVYASVRHAPLGKAMLIGLKDADAGSRVRGFLKFVEQRDWVAAVADNWWAAERALTLAQPRFRVVDGADSGHVSEALDHAMHMGKAKRLESEGDDDLVSGGMPIQIRYDVSPALHATIETATATARYANGRLELWAGTQAPEETRQAAARALGIDPAAVVLYPMAIGGSFDRRLETREAAEAAVLAKALGRPVQVVWSRRQEHVAGWPRTPVAAVMGARLDTGGGIGAWRARIAMPATTREFGRRLFAGDDPWQAMAAVDAKADAMALEGAHPPYAVPNLAIDHVPVSIGLPTARMRGNSHSYTAFFTESFVDELAHRAGREPLAYRMAMLGRNPRLAECLQRVASLAQWDGGVDNSGQGIACHAIVRPGLGEGRIAAVAVARLDGGGVRVDKLFAVADIGRIVNLDIARQQIEGGLIFGLGLALGSAIGYAGGWPSTDRLGDLALPGLANSPEIQVEFVESDASPADPGELGVAVAPPAIANALYSATGTRYRRLPLTTEDF